MVGTTVGRPQIVPLLVPKFRPDGRLGLMAHEVIVPEPVTVAFSGKSVLDWPLVSVMLDGEYESVGNWSITTRVIVVVFVPPELRNVIVYVVLVESAVGVPEISPVIMFKLNPAGRAGLME